MNSKLYQRYLSLKIENSDIFYLFKSKDYYFFVSDDAIKASSLLNLSLNTLSSIIPICEITCENLNFFLDKLNDLNLKVEIVSLSFDIFNYDLEKFFNSTKPYDIITNFLNIKIDDLSISQSYELLNDLQKKLKDFKIN